MKTKKIPRVKILTKFLKHPLTVLRVTPPISQVTRKLQLMLFHIYVNNTPMKEFSHILSKTVMKNKNYDITKSRIFNSFPTLLFTFLRRIYLSYNVTISLFLWPHYILHVSSKWLWWFNVKLCCILSDNCNFRSYAYRNFFPNVNLNACNA